MPHLHFKGRSLVENHHLTVPFHELRAGPSRGLSTPPSLHDNLVIHGDNLAALKALQPTLYRQVKCICIDPPYNTGNEDWVYNDNVNSPMMRAWLGKAVDREDLTRHDKWCCMMLPRLKLLRELLRDDGAIFVTIDDNEVHHLRTLMDEVFGEDNFVATVIWQKIFSPKNTARHFSQDHDFILVYARDAERWTPNRLKRSENARRRYKNPDNDARGPWASSDLTARNYYSKGTYEVTSPSGKVFRPAVGRYFIMEEEKFHELDRDRRIWWGARGQGMPRLKRFLSEVQEGVVPQTLWSWRDVGHTQAAKKELVALADFERSEDVFDTVKPTTLIRRILEIATDDGSIVLDSFAGSGTTAHAVLAQNKEDGGNRRFVLIECEDYADTLTAERVRRVAQGVPDAKDDGLREGLGGTFSYFELGGPMREESLLDAGELPAYDALAGYIFFTATGEELRPDEMDRSRWLIGSTASTDVFLVYEPDAERLKVLALDLAFAKTLPPANGRKRVVFAPTKYLDECFLNRYEVEFCQLPFEIYRAVADS